MEMLEERGERGDGLERSLRVKGGADCREIGGVTWQLGLSIVKRKSECKMVGFGMISALKVIIMLQLRCPSGRYLSYHSFIPRGRGRGRSPSSSHPSSTYGVGKFHAPQSYQLLYLFYDFGVIFKFKATRGSLLNNKIINYLRQT